MTLFKYCVSLHLALHVSLAYNLTSTTEASFGYVSFVNDTPSAPRYSADHIMLVAIKKDDVILYTYLNENNANEMLTFSKLPLHDVYQPRFAVFDPVDEIVYWSNRYGIYRESIHGGSKKVFIDSPDTKLLQLDYITRKVFWVDGDLFEVNTNGSFMRQVCDIGLHNEDVTGVNIDTDNGIMYFSLIHDDIMTIGSLNLADCSIHTMVLGDQILHGRIAFDIEQHSLHWIFYDRDFANFGYINNGICNVAVKTSFRILYRPNSRFRDIAVYQSYLFFTWNDDGVIGRMQKNGSDQVLFFQDRQQNGQIRLEIQRVNFSGKATATMNTVMETTTGFHTPVDGVDCGPRTDVVETPKISRQEKVMEYLLNNDDKIHDQHILTGDEIASSMADIEKLLMNMLKSSGNRSYSFLSQRLRSKSKYIDSKWELSEVMDTNTNHTVSADIDIVPGGLIATINYVKPEVIAVGPQNTVNFEFSDDNSSNISTSVYIVSGMFSLTVYRGNSVADCGVTIGIPILSYYTNPTLNIDQSSSLTCAFYDILINKWSTNGCSMTSSAGDVVKCTCSHMTSFAVLMKVSSYEIPVHQYETLSIISTIGLALSMSALVVTLTVYMILRKLQNSLRHTIHKNLIGNLIIFGMIFLTAIDKTGHQVICKVVGISLHYEVLCVFMWMLAEAVYLVFKVVKKTPSSYNKLKYYLVVCYVTPLLIVFPVVIVRYDWYTTEKLCWLSTSGRWAVVIPAMTVVLFNLVLLSKMIHIMYIRSGPMKRRSPAIRDDYKQLRFAVRGSFILLPILGVTWVVGPFAVDSNSLVLSYLFNISNSLQGLFIFIAYCLFDKEVRASVKKLRKRKGNVSAAEPNTTNPVTISTSIVVKNNNYFE
ncbi:uncharacterized protein LOC117101551 [Anneissia japonica]|uniref:uncharacterized protein LOC117101551 n=1 Tax=Anneissia japonica TaxID=1529436 RepID=UPI0014255B02|nr:uncharacterized protein LOC117101551 [Anneissia japonica]